MSFDPDVYRVIRAGIQSSAARIVPMLLHHTGTGDAPRCLDVGCGEGWWSDALWDAGVAHVDSIDHPLPAEAAEGLTILDVDLESRYTLQRGYGLALCLEVAEHLSPEAGDYLVHQLTRCSRAVAWSAAIPGQGGSGHLNEQWPAYWEERFAANGWAFIDPFRDALWGDPDVEPWYQQNLLLAVPAIAGAGQPVRPLVHPAIFNARVAERDQAWAYARGLEEAR